MPNKPMSTKFQFIYTWSFVFICIYLYLFVFIDKVMAQSISLSVSPPLLEVIIQPDKEIRQVYTVTNNGSDTLLKPKIVYFIPSDTEGNVEITEVAAPEWVKYSKDVINLKADEQKTFNVVINPPLDTPETDHFLTLVFETATEQNNIGANNTFYKTEIGSNILVAVSKDGNPKKSAEIIEFSAPRIIDSLSTITYSLTLANNGNSFWKPNGKIIIDDEKSLKIAPLNVLSGYSRKISCLEGDELKDCNTDPDFKIGIIKSKLEFRLDEESEVYNIEAVTYSFPFVLLFAILMLLTLFKSSLIFKVWKKRN